MVINIKGTMKILSQKQNILIFLLCKGKSDNDTKSLECKQKAIKYYLQSRLHKKMNTHIVQKYILVYNITKYTYHYMSTY